MPYSRHNIPVRGGDAPRAYIKAADAIRGAITKFDADVRALHRRTDLFPAEREQRITEARAAVEATIRQQRAETDAALTEHRSWARYREEPPTAEEAAQRSYYATSAAAELSGLTNPTDVLATVKAVAAEGNDARSREYVRAAAGRAPAGALAGLARQVEDVHATNARHWTATCDELERQIGWLGHHVGSLLKVAGHLPPEVREGRAPEEPLDTRVLGLWADALDGRAAEAFDASKAYAASTVGIAEAMAEGGAPGWDATGDTEADHSDARALGEPPASASTPGDATADQGDASTDAGVRA